MKNLINTITKVGNAIIASGANFTWCSTLDGERSEHNIFHGADAGLVFDDDDCSDWSAHLDLNQTPTTIDVLTDLITSVVGAPQRVNNNGTRLWEVDGVVIICYLARIEFREEYIHVKTPRR